MAEIDRLLDECGKGSEEIDWAYLFNLDLTQRTPEFYETLDNSCQVSHSLYTIANVQSDLYYPRK